jgi:transposase
MPKPLVDDDLWTAIEPLLPPPKNPVGSDTRDANASPIGTSCRGSFSSWKPASLGNTCLYKWAAAAG